MMHHGAPVSASIDIRFDDRIDSSCWRRAARPARAKLLMASILIGGLLLGSVTIRMIGVAAGFVLAGLIGAAITWMWAQRSLHAVEAEVRACTTADAARTLLGSLRARRIVEWFGPVNFVPLMEGRLQLRIGDYRAAAAA